MTRPSRRDRFATVVALGGVLVAAASLVDGNAWIALVQAAGGVVAVALVVFAAVLATRRRLVRALLALAAAVVLLWPIVRLPDPPAQGTRTLSVLSINTYVGRADAAAIVREVDARRVDVLVLPEMTDDLWSRLQAAGLRDRLPHITGRTGGGPGMIVATRAAAPCVDLPDGVTCGQVVSTPVNEEHPRPFDRITVRLGDETLVRGVHLWSPRLAPASAWANDQIEMRDWIAAHAGRRLVLAGDFNAGPAQPAWRRYASALTRSPKGGIPWTRTWPSLGPVHGLTQVDHVLARGWSTRRSETVLVPGSDHQGVWTLLAR